MFADRQAATAEAVRPVVLWCEGEGPGDRKALRAALAAGMEDYMSFLLGRPAFTRFISWEELHGAQRLRETERSSTALSDAFSRLRSVARRRGLAPFRVEDAVLLFISLTYTPLAHRQTFLVPLGLDLSKPALRRRHVRLAADQMMRLFEASA